jgi:BirA family transcriptional regulator, biotin operon repressor / biotin---[acetyl-CoA-carboxylase] ligase
VIGEPRLYEPECESTQLLLLESDLPEGAVAVTDHQTGGRGRLGRAWVDAPGTSVLCSVLLRPPEGSPAPQLSLVCGLAVAEAVEEATGLAAQLKWPNDVMLDRRKVAGILLEARGGAVICGIGVNVNQTREQLPADVRTPAGSLRTVTGRSYDREVLLADVLARLESRYLTWREQGLAALHDGVGARNFLFGRRVRIDGRVATAGSLLPDGRLELTPDGGETILIESGDLDVER